MWRKAPPPPPPFVCPLSDSVPTVRCLRCGVVCRYLQRESLIDAMATLDGTILDERVIKVEVDKGFYEGRQYGRGETGGQVRDEVRRTMDIERGGAPGELTQLPFTPPKYPEPPGGVPIPRSRAGAAGGRGGQTRRGGRSYDRDRRAGGGGGGGYRGRDNTGGGAGHEREYDNRERGYGRGGDREYSGGRDRGRERDHERELAAPVAGMKRGRYADAGAGAGPEAGAGYRSRDADSYRSRDAELDGAAAAASGRGGMEPTSRDRYREGADAELDEFGRIRRPVDFDAHDDIKRRRLEEME